MDIRLQQHQTEYLWPAPMVTLSPIVNRLGPTYQFSNVVNILDFPLSIFIMVRMLKSVTVVVSCAYILQLSFRPYYTLVISTERSERRNLF
jgi:hypothetical protein